MKTDWIVLLNDVIPTGAQLVEIKPSVAQTIEDDVKTQLVDPNFSQQNIWLKI